MLAHGPAESYLHLSEAGRATSTQSLLSELDQKDTNRSDSRRLSLASSSCCYTGMLVKCRSIKPKQEMLFECPGHKCGNLVSQFILRSFAGFQAFKVHLMTERVDRLPFIATDALYQEHRSNDQFRYHIASLLSLLRYDETVAAGQQCCIKQTFH